MKGTNIFKILLLIAGPLVIISIFFWFIQEKKVASIYILDKTVPDRSRSEHKSFSWILTYNKYVGKDKKLYSYKNDYYGYFPDKQPNIRSLRLYEILSIPDDLDMVYYTDTYGVTYQDLYNRQPDKLHSSLIYGGLNQNDYLLLSEMKRKNKLIVCEFNSLASPTPELIRDKTENLFDFTWTGWTGCYISSLRVSNPNLPDWLIAQYESTYKKKWEFEGPGIIFVQEMGNIVVLDLKNCLEQPFPQIVTGEYGQKNYHLPASQNYSFWFDVINTGTSNSVISQYVIPVNKKGAEILNTAGIKNQFPAIVEHLEGYKFYYFAGDFCDRDMAFGTAYFKGISSIARFFCLKNSSSKKAFFWRFYLPLMENILAKQLPATATVNKN